MRGGARLISSTSRRRRAIDLVDEQDIRKHRPGHEFERALGLVEDRKAGDVRRQQIGSALQAAKLPAQGLRNRAREHRLADARDVVEQQMAAAEEGGYGKQDLLLLAVHNAAQILVQGFERRAWIGHASLLACVPYSLT